MWLVLQTFIPATPVKCAFVLACLLFEELVKCDYSHDDLRELMIPKSFQTDAIAVNHCWVSIGSDSFLERTQKLVQGRGKLSTNDLRDYLSARQIGTVLGGKYFHSDTQHLLYAFWATSPAQVNLIQSCVKSDIPTSLCVYVYLRKHKNLDFDMERYPQNILFGKTKL